MFRYYWKPPRLEKDWPAISIRAWAGKPSVDSDCSMWLESCGHPRYPTKTVTARCTALANYHAPGLDVVGVAGYGLPASDWSFGYARSFSRRASAFDCSICFILRSGTRPRGVPGSASSGVHAATDHLLFSSDPLALLAARCRHLCACHIRILSDGKNTFPPAVEPHRTDYGRLGAPNISVPTQTTGSGR